MNFLRPIKHLLAAFFPFRCHSCKESCGFGVVLCPNCLNQLRESIESPILVNDTKGQLSIYTISDYTSFAANVVRIIKYRPSKKLAKVLGQISFEEAGLKDFLSDQDVIIPVPMHPKRLAERGFNQAAVIAETLADLGNTYYCEAIVRSRYTKPQASCTEEERKENLENVFELDPNLDVESLRNKRLIIIDDVATTGTTLEKTALPLAKVPAKEVIALVISHSYKQAFNLN